MPEAIIYDLDGVLTDTAEYHYRAWKKIAEELGIPFGRKENEKLKGLSREKSLEMILQLGNKQLSAEEKKALTDKKNLHYQSLIRELTPAALLPGIRETLTYFKQKGIPQAVASSSKNARLILEKLELNDFFDAVTDGTEIRNAKPDPEIFLKTAAKMQVSPQGCVVVEDAPAGISAAKAAGMQAVGIGKKEFLSAADTVIPSTANLLPVLIKMFAL